MLDYRTGPDADTQPAMQIGMVIRGVIYGVRNHVADEISGEIVNPRFQGASPAGHMLRSPP